MFVDFPPEHYFQTATQRMRQAQYLYDEGSSFALAIYVGSEGAGPTVPEFGSDVH